MPDLLLAEMMIISNFKTKNMDNLNTLRPSLLWKYFTEILQIPRPSKKEEKIIAYVLDFAEKNNLEYKKDSIGNILISKPASAGYENKKMVVLQSHMDMVCEKNGDTEHNFETDPIQAYTDDGWFRAKGTTLGADNGIGIAAQLAILANSSIKHGPIECLFTVDEETGLTGAYNIKPDFINSSILINLDSEDEGELFIGCAGGLDTIITIPYHTKPVYENAIAFSISIKGLTGGHSGDDIEKGRGNSNKILIRLLWEAQKQFKIKLYDFKGGNLRNAIPREADAIIVLKKKHKEPFLVFCQEFEQTIKHEFIVTEPDLKFLITETDLPESVMKNKSQKRVLNALYACPNGVIEMSREIPGLVQTSSNLASVKFLDGNSVKIVTSQRSSVESAKKNIANRIESQFFLAGGNVTHSDGYPGWTPDTNSEILQITKECYKKLNRCKI